MTKLSTVMQNGIKSWMVDFDFVTFLLFITVEPRFNEPLYSEALGITNDIFQPSNSVMYGKEPRYNEPSI